MMSRWVFCQELPCIRIGNFLLSFSQQPYLRSWAPAGKMLHCHIFCTVWGMLFGAQEIVGAFEWGTLGPCCKQLLSAEYVIPTSWATSWVRMEPQHLMCSFEKVPLKRTLNLQIKESFSSDMRQEALMSMAKNITKEGFIFCLAGDPWLRILTVCHTFSVFYSATSQPLLPIFLGK